MRRRLALMIVVLLGVAMPARAVTIRDLIELTRAGLGEEVLLALVEVDGGVFPVDAPTLRSLKDAGVPERVIAAVVRSGRTPVPQPVESASPSQGYDVPAAPASAFDPYGYGMLAAQPDVIFVESPPRTVVQEVPVPYYVAVPVAGATHHRGASDGSRFDPSRVGSSGLPEPPPNRTDRPAGSSIVYWGNGGRLRPDAWQPAGSTKQGGSRPEPGRGGRDARDDGDRDAQGPPKPGGERRR